MQYLALVISIVLAQLAGVFGSLFTASSVKTWYPTLNKSSANPPSWLFAPVWIALYTLIGIAAYLIWQRRDVPGAKLALSIYAIQLLFNAAWSMIFFGFKQPALAWFEIMLLLLLVMISCYLFCKIRLSAAILLLPYLLWVSFAAYLNYMIWQLN